MTKKIKAACIGLTILAAAISAGAFYANYIASTIPDPEINTIVDIYVVKEDDDIRSVALQYYEPGDKDFILQFIKEIKRLNPGIVPSKLTPGDEIKVNFRRNRFYDFQNNPATTVTKR